MADRSRTFRWMALASTTCIALAAGSAAALDALVRLEPYNVDPSQVSVSGYSGGGVMAMQLGIAYSSRIMGVAAFGSIPYDCLRTGGAVTPDSCAEPDGSLFPSTRELPPDIGPLEAHIRQWSGKEIDSIDNLKPQRAFIFVGAGDILTSRALVEQTAKLYGLFLEQGNLHFETSIPAKHTFPTDFDHPYSNSTTGGYRCADFNSVLANCGYDGAGALLEWIYGPLKPRTPGLPDGRLVAVNQGEFISRSKGMDAIAFLYVPKSCDAGAVCKLHVFLHPCGRNSNYFDRQDTLYANYSGHSRWAETNGIILLFPQVYPDENLNPNGCWDVKGVFDPQFDQHGGTQIEAIMAMVTRITSGFQATATTRAIEFRHAEWDHYFVTVDADEIAKLDNGTFVGWARTGESFAVAAVNTSGASNVCRFFSTSFAPKSSHFYTADASECETVKSNPDWQFEGLRFAVNLPDAAGNCPADSQPLYRLYNDGQGAAPNHRYTTSLSIHAVMMGAGWISEGVRGCTPL